VSDIIDVTLICEQGHAEHATAIIQDDSTDDFLHWSGGSAWDFCSDCEETVQFTDDGKPYGGGGPDGTGNRSAASIEAGQAEVERKYKAGETRTL